MKTNHISAIQKQQKFIFRLIIVITTVTILILNACLVFAQHENTKLIAKGSSGKEKNDPSMNQNYRYYYAGINKLEENNLTSAKRYLNRSIQSNPEHAQSFDRIGQVYAKMKNYHRAIENFNIAISLDETRAEFFYNRALAHTYVDHIELSIPDCDQAIKLNPQYAEAFLVRGISKAVIGESESSMDDLRKAVELKPDYAEAYFNIGLNYYELFDDANAKINFKKATELGYNIENFDTYLKTRNRMN